MTNDEFQMTNEIRSRMSKGQGAQKWTICGLVLGASAFLRIPSFVIRISPTAVHGDPMGREQFNRSSVRVICPLTHPSVPLHSACMSKPSSNRMIRLRGVRHNNLKNFDLDLPLNQLIVITGLSGSG